MEQNVRSLNTGEQSTVNKIIWKDCTDNNGDISNTNGSHAVTESSLPENNSQLKLTPRKLGITCEESEIKAIRHNCNGYSSIIHSTEKTNGSLEYTKDETSKGQGSFSENVTSLAEDDESVISVEEDDVMEVSILDTSFIETPQKEMFSHLQTKKHSVDNEIELEHMQVENENESTVLDETCVLTQDESKLFNHSLVELGRRLWHSTAEKQLYTKGCLWSPDGTCLLAPVHLDGMHVVELPTDLYTMHELPDDRGLNHLTSAVHVKEGGNVYDFCWYPFMNSADPATCCWLATRHHEPIHMWDAFTGELRCSYRGYNYVDEVESAISIIFSSDAQKVIGGFKKTIKIFDTNLPGRDCTSITIKKAVSCFALTTDNDYAVTAGTWAGYINHYDLRAPKLGPLFTLGGHSGGITLLKYSPGADKNWYLFSGARKDNKILQWDMRNYTEPMQVFERSVRTNQRIYYDLTPLNKWLASGDTDGLLRIWNLEDTTFQFELPLHQDCCNGVSFHPSLPIIATSSGQYHFVDITDSDEKPAEKSVTYENSLLMLWYGSLKQNHNFI